MNDATKIEIMKKCPNCQEELIAVPAQTRTKIGSWILLIAGIFLTPILIGIILIIIAVCAGFTEKIPAHKECPGCGWSSRYQK